MLVVMQHAYNMHVLYLCCQLHGQQQPSLQLTSSAAWTRASQQMLLQYCVTYSVYGCHVVSMRGLIVL